MPEGIHGRKIARKLAGLAESDRQQGTLRARASAAFVAGTMDQRFDRHAAAHEQGADTFWRIHLVAGGCDDKRGLSFGAQELNAHDP